MEMVCLKEDWGANMVCTDLLPTDTDTGQQTSQNASEQHVMFKRFYLIKQNCYSMMA